MSLRCLCGVGSHSSHMLCCRSRASWSHRCTLVDYGRTRGLHHVSEPMGAPNTRQTYNAVCRISSCTTQFLVSAGFAAILMCLGSVKVFWTELANLEDDQINFFE